MKIVIDPFDTKTITNAIKQVKKYKTWINKCETELLEKLGSIGVTRAQVLYNDTIAKANSDIHARLEDITVTKSVTGNRLIIQARGRDVAFVEFGSGVKYGYGYPATQVSGVSGRPPEIVGIGEYGNGKGKNPKGWWYSKNGESHHSYGNPPAMGMYHAEEDIIERVTQVAREVFKNGGQK